MLGDARRLPWLPKGEREGRELQCVGHCCDWVGRCKNHPQMHSYPSRRSLILVQGHRDPLGEKERETMVGL